MQAVNISNSVCSVGSDLDGRPQEARAFDLFEDARPLAAARRAARRAGMGLLPGLPLVLPQGLPSGSSSAGGLPGQPRAMQFTMPSPSSSGGGPFTGGRGGSSSSGTPWPSGQVVEVNNNLVVSHLVVSQKSLQPVHGAATGGRGPCGARHRPPPLLALVDMAEEWELLTPHSSGPGRLHACRLHPPCLHPCVICFELSHPEAAWGA